MATPAKKGRPAKVVEQGVFVLWSAKKADVDIVAVPGLGADPDRCWTKDGFDWLTHKDGLQKDFDNTNNETARINARVLLYKNPSAWQGKFKVKALLHDLASTLLNGLAGKRVDVNRRPIVFIGHSMGGLVIAKAICLANSNRRLWPGMFEAICGSLFFGTPFEGTTLATAAKGLDTLLSSVGLSSDSALLDLMKPKNTELEELKNDFLRLANDRSLGANMELFCFYELLGMDMSKLGLPHTEGPIMVERESATLPGHASAAMARNHSALVTFDGSKDELYQLIRVPIKRIVQSAPSIAKSRFTTVRDIDHDKVKAILTSLEGVQVGKKYQEMKRDMQLSYPSWILLEKECIDWLTVGDKSPSRDCLWIIGHEGKGKSTAVVSIIDQIEKESAQAPAYSGRLLAYFFCGSSKEACTAEELLKSLLWQLIYQQETLAVYAESRSSGFETKPTVENLWQRLQDLLSDNLVENVYFVIHNIHTLPEEADGTKKLMERLQHELTRADSIETRVKVRWLFTSVDHYYIRKALVSPSTKEIDLTNEKYNSQVGDELKRHADRSICTLVAKKQYSKSLSYFANSLIVQRAEDTNWIDLTCLCLAEIPPNTRDLKIRRELEQMPADLNKLLQSMWNKILREAGDEDIDEIKEILRVLLLTFEPVTLDELAVLSDTSNDDVKRLVGKCKPLLGIVRDKVTFAVENKVKEHLRTNFMEQLRTSKVEMQWQHGILASRCFQYITHTFKVDDKQSQPPQTSTSGESLGESAPAQEGTVIEDSTSKAEKEPADSKDFSDHEDRNFDKFSFVEEEEYEIEGDFYVDRNPQTSEDNPFNLDNKALLQYPVKYWLDHAGEATPDYSKRMISHDQDKEFWSSNSLVRNKWVWAHENITKSTQGLVTAEKSTGLHTAACLGSASLVTALLKHEMHSRERDMRDAMENTPLHLAAFLGRLDTVEELLNNGAAVDDGKENFGMTPLHMAASTGQCQAMQKLLARGADVNAVDTNARAGPVINCAITSGNEMAVNLLVDRKATLSTVANSPPLPARGYLTPLAMAVFTTLEMFDYVLRVFEGALTALDYDEAFFLACGAGKPDIMRRLFPRLQPSEHNYQNDLDTAVAAGNWDCVRILIEDERSRLVEWDKTLIKITEDVEEHLVILRAIWKYAGHTLSKKALQTGLYVATDREKHDTVYEFLNIFDVNPNYATGEEFGDALTAAANDRAIHDGTTKIVDLLLAHNAAVDSPSGWALQIAAAKGHKDLVAKFLDRGADVNRQIKNQPKQFPQCTALQAACEGGYREIVQLLLERGADPNLGGGDYRFPILAATDLGEASIVTMLLQKGADVNVTGGNWDESPLVKAAHFLPVSSIRELILKGADVNYADSYGDTALVTAARKGDADVVMELLQHGADVMQVTRRGMNAMQSAFINSEMDCVRILMDRMSILMAGIKSAADAGTNLPVKDVLANIDYAGLQAEMQSLQEVNEPSEFIDFRVTDFNPVAHPMPTHRQDTTMTGEDGGDTSTIQPASGMGSNELVDAMSQTTLTKDNDFISHGLDPSPSFPVSMTWPSMRSPDSGIGDLYSPLGAARAKSTDDLQAGVSAHGMVSPGHSQHSQHSQHSHGHDFFHPGFGGPGGFGDDYYSPAFQGQAYREGEEPDEPNELDDGPIQPPIHRRGAVRARHSLWFDHQSQDKDHFDVTGIAHTSTF
ncbi:hypothetical protein B0T22DRAFT_457811 [Podospora appendiculata]|uniref:Nephrocystin 3-like N-terminal domain-containing protein n=1 Tax=Podospora appendiculata TaxID=314037 RepID=A0AAE0X807_9PEZI|nr:hypothetical protein B0T22DRAFT_457811 [Podospora appendiculata]